MQVLLVTMLKFLDFKPLNNFAFSLKINELDVTFIRASTAVSLLIRSRKKMLLNIQLRFIFIDQINIFTKQAKPNKLYIDSNKGIFLSSGLILKFLNKDKQRFLKKRLKTWYGFLKALLHLQQQHSIVYFNDLIGKKSMFLAKFAKSRVKFIWLFIKLYSLESILQTKRSRRIKRWIKKKYYQLGVLEKR